MKRLASFLVLIFLLAACAPFQTATEQWTPPPASTSGSAPTPTDDPALLPTLFPNVNANSKLARLDEQGAVIFDVTPLNLGSPSATLDFDIAMNTHSVDLSMDLAMLSTLATDTGVTVQASKWDATPGGHHVEGTLIFPSELNGKPILEDASKLTLTIVNVDAPSRVFEWELK